MSHVIKVLRGAGTKRVLGLGYDRLTVYGIARDFADDELRQTVSLLLARGLLVKNGNNYPTLAVTQAGRTFLKRRHNLVLTKPTRSAEVAPARDATALAYGQTLFERLRALRRSIADARGVPSFVIFGDVALQQMAFYLPQSHESFSRISGVGAAKLAQFSEEFLEVIRQHGLPERSIPPRRRERNRTVRFAGSTYDETKKLLLQKLPISEIAERRELAVGTIISHLEQLAMAGEELDLGHLMPPAERFAKIKEAFENSGSLTLAPVRESLGEEYSYEELGLVRVCLRQDQDSVR